MEVELHLQSKNDYEYLLIDDRKAAGFEAIDGKCGYTYTGLAAYVDSRDERVSFFVQHLTALPTPSRNARPIHRTTSHD